MCVSISGQDVVDYIFSSDKSRKFVSYQDVSAFKKELASNIFSISPSDAHYASVYFEPLREISESRYEGMLVRESDGFRLYGRVSDDALKSLQGSYHDEKITGALAKAYCAVLSKG